ncbi:OB-fold putative lipoprotein [Bacteroidia bacterium]|nr:OB-fold putative lipoprotein [Bacteroidia bacterium]MDB4107772.1 OB-fold putative lipoprotein [Bacteroidia bacterium]MDB9883251.1 OB-fold putative lipoprotein [Bacteroidia bacterium]
MKRPILLFIALLVLGAVYYAYKSYNKPHTNVEETAAAESLTAANLFDAFDRDETAAMTKYADKVIQVNGSIFQIDLSNDAEPQVVLQGNSDNGYIRCGFKSSEADKVKTLNDNATLNVKGLCKGFNSSEDLDLLADKDVVLSNCTIIE